MLKEGVILGERYEIISRIGSGGMADVYKAKDHKLNRMVAVKVLKPEFREDKTFIRKFRTDAQAAAGLSHPNIVNVYDVGEDHGVYYIVMELVEGGVGLGRSHAGLGALEPAGDPDHAGLEPDRA